MDPHLRRHIHRMCHPLGLYQITFSLHHIHNPLTPCIHRPPTQLPQLANPGRVCTSRLGVTLALFYSHQAMNLPRHHTHHKHHPLSLYWIVTPLFSPRNTLVHHLHNPPAHRLHNFLHALYLQRLLFLPDTTCSTPTTILGLPAIPHDVYWSLTLLQLTLLMHRRPRARFHVNRRNSQQ